jgi:hypothetical protein
LGVYGFKGVPIPESMVLLPKWVEELLVTLVFKLSWVGTKHIKESAGGGSQKTGRQGSFVKLR